MVEGMGSRREERRRRKGGGKEEEERRRRKGGGGKGERRGCKVYYCCEHDNYSATNIKFYVPPLSPHPPSPPKILGNPYTNISHAHSYFASFFITPLDPLPQMFGHATISTSTKELQTPNFFVTSCVPGGNILNCI